MCGQQAHLGEKLATTKKKSMVIGHRQPIKFLCYGVLLLKKCCDFVLGVLSLYKFYLKVQEQLSQKECLENGGGLIFLTVGIPYNMFVKH